VVNALAILDDLAAAAPAAKALVPAAGPPAAAPAAGVASSLPFFAYRTAVNARRHATAMQAFREDQFGTTAAAPTPSHIRAVNALLQEFHGRQEGAERQLARVVHDLPGLGDAGLARLLSLKERAQSLAGDHEKVWEFYLNLFDQRTGPFAAMLRGIDRLALDCYQAVYLGLGEARSIPSPTPFAYVETGFGPATFRRGVKLSKLAARANPFPLVKVPYHRLINPWTLGAVAHEVAHNLQSDLGLWENMPGRIGAAFARAGLSDRNGDVWQRWHKETYADLAGVLLIGPAYIGSLMDVVGRSRASTAAYSDDAVHPTPIIRVPLNIRLLERIGLGEDAQAFRRAWDALYPASAWAQVPDWVRHKLPQQIDTVLDAICFEPCGEYGGRALTDVVRFEPKHSLLVREAATRMERGDSTGVLPERFLIAAARVALGRARTSPETIHRNFYDTLMRC
jgi:hypothetical protein